MSDPVQIVPADQETATPEPGVGLCLSGGGYRAMVFHAGVLWRLYETGLSRTSKSNLERFRRIDYDLPCSR